jgi:hypothetical protein
VTLVNRFAVEGTSNPIIHVGHKSYRKKDGTPARTKTYYAEWSLGNKQRRKSLGTKNKAAAINAAHALHDKLCSGERLEAPKEYTVDEAVKLYLDTCRARRLKRRTMAAYGYTLGKLTVFCEDRAVVYLSRFGQIEFWAFIDTMNHLAKKTVYDRMVIVQQFFKWCCDDAEIIQKNPIRKLKLKKPASKKQPCFTPEQIRTMILNGGRLPPAHHRVPRLHGLPRRRAAGSVVGGRPPRRQRQRRARHPARRVRRRDQGQGSRVGSRSTLSCGRTWSRCRGSMSGCSTLARPSGTPAATAGSSTRACWIR